MSSQEENIGQPHDDAILREFFARGGSIRMLGDVAATDLQTLHTYACQLFDAGELQGARNYFALLVQLDHWRFDYWLGLGMCQQRLAAHDQALLCFSRAALIDALDPRSSYFAGISYYLTGNREYACKAFNATIKWCAAHPQHQALRQSAQQMLGQCEGQG